MFFLGQGQGQGNNHFNPDQPRGPDGRWIAEDDDTYTPGPDSPGPGPGNRWRARAVGDDSDIGRAKSIVGYAARELETSLGRFHRVARPDRATAARYARLFRTWDAADDLDDRSFHDRDLGPGIPPAAIPWLQRGRPHRPAGRPVRRDRSGVAEEGGLGRDFVQQEGDQR